MLSSIDNILFPDECIVLKYNTNKFVYPIYKNGYTSIGSMNLEQVQDFSSVDSVDVYIRNPIDRFISGVNTYLTNHCQNYDKKTVLYFIQEFLFLNRHFCPQFFWLVNLRRYTDAKINLISFDKFNLFSPYHHKPPGVPTVDKSLEYIINDKIRYYLLLDKVLYEDLLGQTVKFSTIIDTLESKYPTVYADIIKKSKNICNALG